MRSKYVKLKFSEHVVFGSYKPRASFIAKFCGVLIAHKCVGEFGLMILLMNAVFDFRVSLQVGLCRHEWRILCIAIYYI